MHISVGLARRLGPRGRREGQIVCDARWYSADMQRMDAHLNVAIRLRHPLVMPQVIEPEAVERHINAHAANR